MKTYSNYQIKAVQPLFSIKEKNISVNSSVLQNIKLHNIIIIENEMGGIWGKKIWC